MATNKKNRRLQELSHSDFEIADGEPDIKGWDVKLENDDRKIGEVDDLIFDTNSNKVRYLKVDLEGKVFDTDSRDVLVPIGLANIKNLTNTVQLANVTLEQLKALPDYDDDHELAPTEESRIRQVFGGAAYAGTTMDDTDFYAHDHFSDRNFYDVGTDSNANLDTYAATTSTTTSENVLPETGTGYTTGSADLTSTNDLGSATTSNAGLSTNDDKIDVIREDLAVGKREVQTGGIRIRSRIVERPVEESINLREETVTVERTPVNKVVSNADFTEKEIEMREHAEVPVVNKEARVVEEISVTKDVEERDEVIRDTVRETHVEVDEISDPTRKRTT